MKVVVKLQNKNLVSEIPVEGGRSIIIGRGRSADCKVLDQLVSANHCVLEFKNNRLGIKDLSSKNGTFINGIRIEQADFFIGDEIRLGDTRLTLAAEKMDASLIHKLSLPDKVNNRISHELRLDFTGLRKANPFFYKDIKGKSRDQVQGELLTRNIAQSRIRLSKHEIKKRNQVRSTMASTIDVLLCMASIALPLLVMNIVMLTHTHLFRENRLTVLTLAEMVTMALFFILNFKMLRFSLGEKFAGIERLYRAQS